MAHRSKPGRNTCKQSATNAQTHELPVGQLVRVKNGDKQDREHLNFAKTSNGE